MTSSKYRHGQYFTTVSPFKGEAWDLWNSQRPETVVLEPFAGSGNLFEFVDTDWMGYDLEPQHPEVQQRNTLESFPTGYSVCITNPPYLAKNAASRKKMNISIKYEDMYLDALEKCLDNCEWVAAIIPATFYRSGMFAERLMAWDKIDYQLFEDTDAPVGVAYFGPDTYSTRIFVNGTEVEAALPDRVVKLTFNTADGSYVMCGIDSTAGDSIEVRAEGTWFDRSKYLKHTSRNYVLFSSPSPINIEKTNSNIQAWRDTTRDFYLTPFKSMQKTGKYRKRISFDEIERLVVLA